MVRAASCKSAGLRVVRRSGRVVHVTRKRSLAADWQQQNPEQLKAANDVQRTKPSLTALSSMADYARSSSGGSPEAVARVLGPVSLATSDRRWPR